MGGDRAGVSTLVVARLVEPDGEGFYSSWALLRHNRGHQRAIDAARQKSAQRHVADESHLHAAGDNVIQLIEQLAFGTMRPIAIGFNAPEAPISMEPYPISIRKQIVRGRQLLDVLIKRMGRRNVADYQKEPKGLLIYVLGNIRRQIEQRARTRGEHEARFAGMIIKWLHPHTVAGAKQPLVLPVQNDEHKHPAEVPQTLGAPLGIRFEHHYRNAETTPSKNKDQVDALADFCRGIH